MTDYIAYGCRECQAVVFAKYTPEDLPDGGCPTCGNADPDPINCYVRLGLLR